MKVCCSLSDMCDLNHVHCKIRSHIQQVRDVRACFLLSRMCAGGGRNSSKRARPGLGGAGSNKGQYTSQPHTKLPPRARISSSLERGTAAVDSFASSALSSTVPVPGVHILPIPHIMHDQALPYRVGSWSCAPSHAKRSVACVCRIGHICDFKEAFRQFRLILLADW